jgi:transposase-like protein
MEPRRYSETFKRTVIEAIDRGELTRSEAEKKYDIGGSCTVPRWYKEYGKRHLIKEQVWIAMADERSHIKKLESENAQLRKALVNKELRILQLEAEKELLEERSGKVIKKKTDSGSSLVC